MIHTIHSHRVRYGETDPMKYVYYGNYASFLEAARVEQLRSIGISYNELENQGIWLPVSEYRMKYIKPALYDQIIDIHTYLKKKPGVRMHFEYEIYNEKKELLSTAEVTLYFFDAQTQKITRCPEFLSELIEKNWKED